MVRVLTVMWLGMAGAVLASDGSWVSALWSAPLVVAAAFLTAWGAEALQFMVSQGLALALLAWLQTLPEFAVEADIAWNAARHTPGYSDHLVTANFTGSIRLLMGFGMPTLFFIRWWKRGRQGGASEIALDPFHSVEIVSLFPPTVYFFFIAYRGRLDLLDSVILLGFYGMYMWLLLRMPPEREESADDLPWAARRVLRRGRAGRIAGIASIFACGGCLLWYCVHPFVRGLQSIAGLVGVSSYFFIQWIAPFLSEFPEKVSAYGWALREGKAKVGVVNLLSSNINQMTVLVAMIPVVYASASGRWNAPIRLTTDQVEEVTLTASQAALCMVLLFNMKFEWWEAVGVFVLWVAQFTSTIWEDDLGLRAHTVRHCAIFVNLGWAVTEVFLALIKVRRWDFPFRMRR